jgi:hypothetical protein
LHRIPAEFLDGAINQLTTQMSDSGARNMLHPAPLKAKGGNFSDRAAPYYSATPSSQTVRSISSNSSKLSDQVENVEQMESFARSKEVGSFILSGRLEINLEVADPVENFFRYFYDFFFDASRRKHAETLVPVVHRLVNGTLEGQMNCFLGLGPHGVGKTSFFHAVGMWSCSISTSSFVFIYVDSILMDEYRTDGTPTVSHIIHNVAKRVGWDVPEMVWETMRLCWQWLIDEHKSVLMVLDEFDVVFQSENDIETLISDLSVIGSAPGKRPIVMIIMGSSSYLRNLCFRRVDLSELVGKYPGYKFAVNLNSTKFISMSFMPIYEQQDVENTLACLQSDPPPQMNWMKFMKRTRGLVRRFESALQGTRNCDNADVEIELLERWSRIDRKHVLEILWNHVSMKLHQLREEEHALDSTLSGFDSWMSTFACPLDVFTSKNISVHFLHQCADEGLLRLDDGAVSFLHPVDMFSCEKLVLTKDGITSLEIFSLVRANDASADEINEDLVGESICLHGVRLKTFGLLLLRQERKVMCSTGIARKNNKEPAKVDRAYGNSLLDKDTLGCIRKGVLYNSVTPAALRKEFPDETGADLIAVFSAHGFGVIKYLILRIQVKLGTSDSSVDESAGTPLDKMMKYEALLLESVGLRPDEVIFARVLWTSRPTAARTDEQQNILVINSNNMLDWWCHRVQQYVKTTKNVSYGYKKSWIG